MKYVLTIMMRRMVKLNLIEIKIQDLQFSLHFLFFFAVQEGCTEISLRLRKKFTGICLDVRGGMCYLCIVNLNTSLTEVMVIISMRLILAFFLTHQLVFCGLFC